MKIDTKEIREDLKSRMRSDLECKVDDILFTNGYLYGKLSLVLDEHDAQQIKLAEAEKVIRFYADKKNWTPQGPIAEVVFNKPDGVVTVNFEDGVKAQEWLKKYGEEK